MARSTRRRGNTSVSEVRRGVLQGHTRERHRSQDLASDLPYFGLAVSQQGSGNCWQPSEQSAAGQAGLIIGAAESPCVLMTGYLEHLPCAFQHTTSQAKAADAALEISRRVSIAPFPRSRSISGRGQGRGRWGGGLSDALVFWKPPLGSRVEGWSNGGPQPNPPLGLEACNHLGGGWGLPLIHTNWYILTFSHLISPEYIIMAV